MIGKKRLVVLDVDGVLTDGTKMYGKNGEVFGKRFCDHDFTAIKKFKMAGWDVVWLSADLNINAVVAKDRGIEFYSSMFDGKIDKINGLNNILEMFNGQYRLSDVVYAGDDLYDVDIMKLINDNGGYTFCPIDAVKHVRDVAMHTTYVGGGCGVVMDIMNFVDFDGVAPCV